MDRATLLVLAKALLETATELESIEPMEKSEEHEDWMRNHHYAAHYKGARSFGASHRHAHKAAKQYVATLKERGADMERHGPKADNFAQNVGREAGGYMAQHKRKGQIGGDR